MEVLKDLKCIDKAEFRCVWLGEDPKSRVRRPELRIPALLIVFNHPDAMGRPALCISFATRGFASGTPAHDEQIRRVIREKVEKYLKMISQDSGRNNPEDMRLDEENYS